MGPESHSAMLPKGMAGSGARMTQKWQRKLGGGEGKGWGWQVGRKAVALYGK